MKKFISIIIAVIMALSITVSMIVFAESNPSLVVTDTKAKIGDTITVDISLENSLGFGGMAYDVKYDNSVLKLISYERSLGSSICTDSGTDTYSDKVNFQYAGTQNIEGDGILVSLVFEVLDTNAQQTEIMVVPEEGTTFYYDDRTEVDFTLDYAVGIVTIENLFISTTQEITNEPTEIQTEISTEVPTELMTQEITEELTEVTTQEITEPATEELTAVPTQTPTEELTETVTQETTEATTEVLTEEITEVPTQKQTEVPTVILIETTVQETTAAIPEVSTVTVTEPVASFPTDEQTEKSTEIQIQKESDPSVATTAVNNSATSDIVNSTNNDTVQTGRISIAAIILVVLLTVSGAVLLCKEKIFK